jgi:acetylornithine deacetylase/succinyl-diaminopimelate desuccinylase-like protein
MNGTRLWNVIQTAEKVYATYTLTTHGDGGHSSLPPRDNAIFRLARALDRLGALQFPVRFSDTTRGYLEAVADRVGGERGAVIRAVLADPGNARALDALRDWPIVNSQLHSTCPATLVAGGQSESALPIQAVATIQCRLLPDEKPADVIAAFGRAIDDPAVEIGVTWAPVPGAEMPLDKDVVATVGRVTREMWPGIGVVPFMSSGASDNVYWRAAGLKAFGVSGTFIDASDVRAHGKDERIPVSAFYESLEFSYRLMRAFAGAR